MEIARVCCCRSEHNKALKVWAFTAMRSCHWSDPTVASHLSMVLEDVDSDNGFCKSGVGALYQVVVQMLLVVQLIKPFEDELEKSPQVFWGWRCHKDVAVSQSQSPSNGQSQCS